MQPTFTSQAAIHPAPLSRRIAAGVAREILALRFLLLPAKIRDEDERVRMIPPPLDLRQRRALHVQICPARAAVVGEPAPGPTARVAGELSAAREEEQGVGGVAAVADAAGQVGAEVVEEEIARRFGAGVGRPDDVVLAAGAYATVLVDLRLHQRVAVAEMADRLLLALNRFSLIARDIHYESHFEEFFSRNCSQLGLGNLEGEVCDRVCVVIYTD